MKSVKTLKPLVLLVFLSGCGSNEDKPLVNPTVLTVAEKSLLKTALDEYDKTTLFKHQVEIKKVKDKIGI